MKRYFSYLLIIGTFFICTVAEGADWILLGKSNIGTSYYDRASIQKISESIIRVSVKYAYSSEGIKEFVEAFPNVDKSEKISYTLYSYDINCSSANFRLTKAVTYNSAGEVIKGTEFNETEQLTPEHINPNSMIEKLSD
jgi:hypothetical protein